LTPANIKNKPTMKAFSLNRFSPLPFVLLLAACTLSGCMSTSPSTGTKDDTLHLSVLPTGTIVFNNKDISRDRLVKTLRRAGATPETTIIVDIPTMMPMTEVSSLTKTLASAGYRRVFCRRPKHAESAIIKP
jgi:hypothetical protein